MPALNDDEDRIEISPFRHNSGGNAGLDESSNAAEMQLKYSSDREIDGGVSPKPELPTMASSQYFVRSRSNAASEEVRPEAKTDKVRSARAKATAEKLYSRRLSKSDMQWALGEDWDPEDSSSLSSLSDLDNAV
ncbi:hypothetical protein GGI18_005939 [Coemansia linderi]|uniref:Uncharacterized protein n=1 Tax=Coemansia linderi TaxID=2663919 RepID=A0ACC1JT16_9FUNG|nr:hypothetical protein GGI18_005939 [Coemansia linderi]